MDLLDPRPRTGLRLRPYHALIKTARHFITRTAQAKKDPRTHHCFPTGKGN